MLRKIGELELRKIDDFKFAIYNWDASYVVVLIQK